MNFRCFLLPTLIVVAQSVFGQIPTHWNSRGVGGGGALFAPSINPANDNEYYVGCDMSELFHSTDFGVTNVEVPFYKTQGGHYSAVQFTNVANTLYSIDYASGAPGYVPIPVKTTDGGSTWLPLSGNPDPSEECYSINVDYNNPNRVLISYYNALYFSSNGGTSFTNIRNAANTSIGIHIAGAFFDGNTIYVGTNEGLLVSTNGGGSFALSTVTGIASGNTMFSFAGAKAGGVTRLLCLTGASADIYVGKPGNEYNNFVTGVYTLDYGSGNWTSKTSGMTLSSDFMMFVGMAKNDINTMYLAGSRNSEPAVMKSTIGGGNWTHVMNTSGNANVITGWCGQGGDRGWGYAESPFGFTVAPNNSQKILITDFGFVHKSSNGGSSWTQAYVDVADQHPAGVNTPAKASYHSAGIENTTCWQVVWGDANTLFAGFSDIRGVRSADGGTTFNFNYNGHSANSMYRIAQHSNGNWYAGTSNIHDMYQSTRLADAQLDATDANGKIIFSTDKGANWSDLHVFSHPVFWVEIDPNNANRMYASVIHSSQGGVYVTQNLSSGSSSTWTKLPNPPRTQGHPASLKVLNDGKLIATYSGRRTTSFTNSSGCFLYDPVANTWTDVSDPGMLYWTKDVIVDPSDATQNTWYVCVFSGWGGAPNGLGGLYKTTNRGGSWTKLTGTQFDRVTSITFNPTDAREAYLTTEVQGLWRSTNMNAATPGWSLVQEYPFRQPERVYFNPYNQKQIWVTSFGNGLKFGNIPVYYTITSSTGPNGTIAPLGVSTVAGGDSAKYIFTPNSGYHVDSVIVDGVMAGTPASYTFYNVGANHTIRVVYAINPPLQFTITASSGPNGSIAPSGSVMVNAGDSSKLAFTPNSGYHVDSVIVDGAMVGTPASYTFYVVQANHTIRVVFAANPIVNYTIVSSNGPNGSITPLGSTLVNAGDSASYIMTPLSGYHIDSVIVDGVMLGAPSSYTFYAVQTNHSIHVTFAVDLPGQYQITSTAGPNGSINPLGVTTVNAGDSADYIMVPNSGYHIDSVFVDGAFVGAIPQYTFYQVAANHSIQVVFAADAVVTYSITATAGANGSISPSGIILVNSGADQSFVFVPNSGFHVDSVFVDSAFIGSSVSYDFLSVIADHTIQVTFAPDPVGPAQYTILATKSGNGSITPSDTVTVNEGDTISFTMTPSTGNVLFRLYIDSAEVPVTSNYIFYNVVANHGIHAEFRADTFDISASAGPNGTINPAGSIGKAAFDSAAFSITPNVGYHIDSVLVDGVNQGPISAYTFYQILSDHSIHAVFAKDPVDSVLIVASAGANGSISPMGNVYVAKGSNIIFTSTPNIGYVVAYYEVDGFKLDGGTSFGLTNILTPRTIKVFFKPDPNGINSNDILSGITLHPNPAKHSCLVELDLIRETSLTIKILNAVGQELTVLFAGDTPAGHLTLEVNPATFKLSSGVYFVSIRTGNESVVKTLIVE